MLVTVGFFVYGDFGLFNLPPVRVLPFNSYTLKDAISVLKNGGVIAHPSDTCFGLAGDLMSQKAFEKIQAIKGRDGKKPMSVMISVALQLKMKRYVELNEFISFVTYHLLPGAVTLVLPKGPEIPAFYFPETDSIGLRVPMHNLTQDILTVFNSPLITTSANLSGKQLCFTHEEVLEGFKESPVQPDIVFEGNCNHFDQASTVLLVNHDHLKVIRQGPVTASQLESILGVPVKG